MGLRGQPDLTPQKHRDFIGRTPQNLSDLTD